MSFWSKACRKINLSSSLKKPCAVPSSCINKDASFLRNTQIREAFQWSCESGHNLGSKRASNFLCRGFILSNIYDNKRHTVKWGRIAQFSTQRIGKSSVGYPSQSLGAYGFGKSQGENRQATLLYLTAMVVAMLGCTYAAVPMYRKFCQATGYGGTVQRRETVEEKIVRHAQDGKTTSREIVVQFNGDVSDGMPWKFVPTQREVRVKPGESSLAFYTAVNQSSTPITGVSTYNVTPMKAAVYFNKIQCFCFEEQRLLPGEQIDMPWIYIRSRQKMHPFEELQSEDERGGDSCSAGVQQ